MYIYKGYRNQVDQKLKSMDSKSMDSKSIWIPSPVGGCLLHLVAPQTETSIPAPLRIIFNLDMSGSMTSYVDGRELRSSIVHMVIKLLTDRRAMKQVSDEVVIVTYDHRTTLHSGKLHELDLETICSTLLVTGGGATSVSGGNDAVYAILSTLPADMLEIELSFTDGYANRDIVGPSEIAHAKAEQYRVLETIRGAHPLLFTYALSSAACPDIPIQLAHKLGGEVVTYKHVSDTEISEFAAELGLVLGLSTTLCTVELSPSVRKTLEKGSWNAWYLDSKPTKLGTIMVDTTPEAIQVGRIVRTNHEISAGGYESKMTSAEDIKALDTIDLADLSIQMGIPMLLTLLQRMRTNIQTTLDDDVALRDIGLLRQLSGASRLARQVSDNYRRAYDIDTLDTLDIIHCDIPVLVRQ
jgi:hypothetical protein